VTIDLIIPFVNQHINMKKSFSISLLLPISLFLSCNKDEPAKLATVTTIPVTNITQTTASSGGNITSNGGGDILANGVCWSANVNPSTVDSKTVNGVGTSQFVSSLGNLTAGTTYYVRAYVTNSAGTEYGNTLSFTTLQNAIVPTAPIVGTITQPTCNSALGSVVLTGLPAAGTWTINPGAITGSGVAATISDLVPGTYAFTVTSSTEGTSVPSSNVVINSQSLTPTAPTVGTITQPTSSLSTGSVELSGLPSSGTWTITGTPGGITVTGTGTSMIISGLAAGAYSFTVTNASGCISVSTGTVVIHVVPAAPIVETITQPNCINPTGSVVLSGLPSAGFWTINPGAISGTGAVTTITNLVPGTYNFTVTDASGSTSVSSADVVINAAPTPPITPLVGTITQPTSTLPTGSVELNGLPASGTWTITGTPGGITTTGTGTSTTVSGLTVGTYTFTVTIESGCTSALSANVVISN
jgi:hypothetical protein